MYLIGTSFFISRWNSGFCSWSVVLPFTLDLLSGGVILNLYSLPIFFIECSGLGKQRKGLQNHGIPGVQSTVTEYAFYSLWKIRLMCCFLGESLLLRRRCLFKKFCLKKKKKFSNYIQVLLKGVTFLLVLYCPHLQPSNIVDLAGRVISMQKKKSSKC